MYKEGEKKGQKIIHNTKLNTLPPVGRHRGIQGSTTSFTFEDSHSPNPLPNWTPSLIESPLFEFQP